MINYEKLENWHLSVIDLLIFHDFPFNSLGVHPWFVHSSTFVATPRLGPKLWKGWSTSRIVVSSCTMGTLERERAVDVMHLMHPFLGKHGAKIAFDSCRRWYWYRYIVLSSSTSLLILILITMNMLSVYQRMTFLLTFPTPFEWIQCLRSATGIFETDPFLWPAYQWPTFGLLGKRNIPSAACLLAKNFGAGRILGQTYHSCWPGFNHLDSQIVAICRIHLDAVKTSKLTMLRMP